MKKHLPSIKNSASIAITVGSRGISNRVLIVKTLVDYLKRIGAAPFIIGAMGSHGGGTSEGQREVLQSLGFTEEEIGCPIYTSDEVIEVAETKNGYTVYCDKYAWESDGIIVLNRIKLHTAFRGLNESGLLKMMTVGLGKSKGANQLHRQGPAYMSETIQEVGAAFIETGKIIAGVGIVENSYEETAYLEVIKPDDILEAERELLVKAKEYFPRVPIENLDLLVVKKMGKNYSGTGMDTNVIGRSKIQGVPEPKSPEYKRIIVTDLHESSHGNATGIGLADFTTEKLIGKLDREKTYWNCITSTYVQRAMIPMVFDNDQQAIQAALKSLAVDNPEELRIAVIENTLHLETLYISSNLGKHLSDKVELLSEPMELEFSEQGNLMFFEEEEDSYG